MPPSDRKRREVFINARFLTQTTTGVQRYAIELVKALDRLIGSGDPVARALSFTLLVPGGAKHGLYLKNISVRQVGRFGGHLWEQLELPLYARRGLLVSLCNAAPLAKTNQIVTVHDAAVFANPRNFSFLFRTWYKVLLTGLGKVASRMLTVSSFSSGEIVRWCKVAESKLHVIHEGKEHALAATADKEILRKHGIGPKPFVLAVSSASPNKNFGAVVHAVEMLKDEDFEVVIAGGTDAKIFAGSDTTLPGFVKSVGYVSDGELRALYEHAACFVYPSFYEGFGLPPLEAMACGCPVIASNAASMPEVCGDAALYCNPHDSKDLAKKIRTLMEDAQLRESLRRAGLQRAERFSWDKCARETLTVIGEATRTKTRSKLSEGE